MTMVKPNSFDKAPLNDEAQSRSSTVAAGLHHTSVPFIMPLRTEVAT